MRRIVELYERLHRRAKQESGIELFEDGEVVETKEPKGESDSWEVEWPAKPGPHFYFTKVTQTDTNLLWSAPIWITVAER